MWYWYVLAVLVGILIGYRIAPAIRKVGHRSNTDPSRDRLYEIAGALATAYDEAASPEDLTRYAGFRNGVELLCGEAFTPDDLVAYFGGDNVSIACLAGEAIRQRQDCTDLAQEILARIHNVAFYPRWFALRYLAEREDANLPIQLLRGAGPSWSNEFAARYLRAYLREQLTVEAATESAGSWDGLSDEHVGFLIFMAESTGTPAGRALAEQLRARGRGAVNVEFLRAFGVVWSRSDDVVEPIRDPGQEQCLLEIEAELRKPAPRSILVVGEAGVGKKTLLAHLGQRLLHEDWIVFEAGSMQVMAGQTYMGELEKHLKGLLDAVGGRRKVLWVVPDLPVFVWAGRHRYSRSGVLDFLLPHIASGHLLVIAPLQPAAFEQLLRAAPALRTAATTVRLSPATPEATLAMARTWVERRGADGPRLCDEAMLRQVHQLVSQYLGDRAAPGNLLEFLERLHEHIAPPGIAPRAATLDDVLSLLSRTTGLPRSILDDREGLRLDELRGLFLKRVMGQPEAVDCLVERVAMIKAGLTDPQRPFGVFLFAGPTGTGKTEIARTLAEFLFGSADRMLQLDMSEFQHPESVSRLLGDAEELEGRQALVHQIRRQPFAIVLLDEIEKAHPTVFDLFLQVFDEGRLTDRRGVPASFRHSLIVLTSNVGVRDLEGGGLGFGPSEAGIDRALEQVFRREFLNRIDRIVVFRSLSRSVMRQILHKELDQVLMRRGLRHRQWAVEWDETAVDFLLEAGFSPTLGARPLRRAIEHYLLAPLAKAIVSERAPAGDQFLFVRSDGKAIQVEFVDPDAPEEEPRAPQPAGKAPTLSEIVLDGAGSPAEIALLADRLELLRRTAADDAWQAKKSAALEAIGGAEFWTSPERFAVLGLAEFMDRIKVALRTAESLARRLWGAQPGRRTSYPAKITRRLAHQIYLLERAVGDLAAGRPSDAWLMVQAVHGPRTDRAAAEGFARDLATMYQRWADRRRMDARVLLEGSSPDGPFRWLMSVAGFGAFSILEGESGLHVREEQKDAKGGAQRFRARVTVAAQPDGPPVSDLAAERRLAHEVLDKVATEATIVRTYRERPSPLVRDRRAGWRTGRLDRVLGGDFDLMG